MTSLPQKYQPLIFDEVRGQDSAVATLRAQVRQGAPAPLLLGGPPGIGKTTLARIFARSLNCDAILPDGSPCLQCENCKDFDTGNRVWFFVEVNGALTGEKSHARYLDELARMSPFGSNARRRVIFVDEAHALTPAASDALLKVLEAPGVAAIVLATSEPHRLSPALRSRCVRVTLHPLAADILINLGRDICATEAVAYEPDALAILAAESNGQARDFLMAIEALAANGAITLATVGEIVDVSGAEHALAVLTALLTGNTATALSAATAWRAPAATKAGALRDALAFVVQRHYQPTALRESSLAQFLCASTTSVTGLWCAAAARAQAMNFAPAQCVVDWGRHWSHAATTVHCDADFSLALYAFANLVLPPDAPLPTAPLAPVQTPPLPSRHRPRGLRAAMPTNPPSWFDPHGIYLTKDVVRAQYRAATLLPQVYGVWLNTRLDLRYGRFGVAQWEAAMKVFSDLTHELGLRVRDWCGDPDFRLHWLCQHEADPEQGYRTWLLLHLPPTLTARARDWVAGHLPTPEGVLVNELGDDVWRSPPNARPNELHWSLLRELWRAVDPLLLEPDEGGRRQPFKELLGVPSQGPRCAGALPPHKRRHSASDTLGPGAWRAANAERLGLVSVFDERAWRALDTGWEALEHRYRLDEARRRAAERAKIEAVLPPGISKSQDAARDKRLQGFFESLPTDPLKRPRTHPLW